MARPNTERQRPKDKEDESIMATNNSSIVSKRSVERLYYSEPHFFRYFVKKPQRRSPLINRGYWLRMHAIDQVVDRFLHKKSGKKKLIINLGCGYDPLPLQWLSKAPTQCRDTIFVDVDFPDLIARKVAVLSTTSALRDLLHIDESHSCQPAAHLRTPCYVALGCDLANTSELDRLLSSELDLAQCMVLCTAEVSLTYMNVAAADNLIAWAGRHDDITFCLLEQFLPAGRQHPFAQKMMEHFDKLHTPLRCIDSYPSLDAQESRFAQRGWSHTFACSLWDIWRDPGWTPFGLRNSLDDVEPFDEWEEFVLFASHYCLIIAENSSDRELLAPGGEPRVESSLDGTDCATTLATHQDLPFEPRRFGASFESSGVIGFHGGLTSQTRSNTTEICRLRDPVDEDAQSDDDGNDHYRQLKPPDEVGLRMCHTITSLADSTALLVGGRTSPDRPLRDCWYLTDRWTRVQDLPLPLYRHCATHITYGSTETENSTGVLVCGGKTESNRISDSWLLWNAQTGWTTLPIQQAEWSALPLFGASIVATEPNKGILLGGMNSEREINTKMIEWELILQDGELILQTPVSFWDSVSLYENVSAPRFGAQVVTHPSGLLLVGGVGNQVHSQMNDVLISPPAEPLNMEYGGPRPLLVGHSIAMCEGELVILGGGAVCFSFGTFTNKGVYLLDLTAEGSNRQLESVVEKSKAPRATVLAGPVPEDAHIDLIAVWSITPIREVQIDFKETFEEMIKRHQPVVLRDMPLGPCLTEWTLANLLNKVGQGREVVVHDANEGHMDFLEKNFTYRKTKFGYFIADISRGCKQYLRSLSSDNPSGKPANLSTDFPELAPDFQLPSTLGYVTAHLHSSVLRISGPVQMWLHYDVMANILCQIQGFKHLRLFPPSDVSSLNLPPGSSSSSINVFATEPSSWMHTSKGKSSHPHDVLLKPGDILFIPPLWLHATVPLDTTSVSVNLFFRDLDSGYAPGRDVYGNRDVQAYEKARMDVARIVKGFERLPEDMAQFYLARLAGELEDQAREAGGRR